MARTNQVVVGQLEKLVEARMDSFKAYVDLGLAQAKVLLRVDDSHSCNEFVDGQFAVSSFISHQMVDDVRTLAEWGSDSAKQTARLFQENTLRLLFKY